MAVNCGAFSEELLTNELFGHEKGAYDFPGNVRELANLIGRGVAMSSGHTLKTEHLSEDL